MSSPVHVAFYGKSKDKKEQTYLYYLSVKTQFAGMEIHKQLIRFLKYISKKYLHDFTITDKGQYWETGDGELPEQTFKQYTFLTDGLKSSIEAYPMHAAETSEAWLKRLLKEIYESLKINNHHGAGFSGAV